MTSKNTEIDQQRKMLVVKSNDFIRRGRFNLSLTEQRIVLYIISKIRPGSESFDVVTFEIRDFCEVCGIQYDANLTQIKEAIKTLADKSMWFLADGGKKETLVRWIEKPYLDVNSGTVRIRLDRDLIPYLLNVRDNYTQYELISILALHSKYSIKLFEWLKSYASMGSVLVSVSDVRDYLQTGDRYPQIKDFNKFVLSRAVDDINAYTGLEVEYRPIKSGKCITGYRFSIAEQQENQYVLAEAYLDGKRPTRHRRDMELKDVIESLQTSFFDECQSDVEGQNNGKEREL